MTSRPQAIDLGFVNAYLLETEDGFLLADTGMRSQRAGLEMALAEAGCAPGKLRLIVATHGDIDHTANCNYLRTKFHAPVAMHAGDVSMVESADWPKRKVASHSLRLMHRFMRSTGVTRRIALADGELICGDTIENRGGLHPTRIVDDEVQLSAGVERLLALDLATVYPGHGRPFSWGQFRVAYGRQRRTP
jgi:glyoxylase-like metal-dependent hydrolase (beta-lactamase superfamily II)